MGGERDAFEDDVVGEQQHCRPAVDDLLQILGLLLYVAQRQSVANRVYFGQPVVLLPQRRRNLLAAVQVHQNVVVVIFRLLLLRRLFLRSGN